MTDEKLSDDEKTSTPLSIDTEPRDKETAQTRIQEPNGSISTTDSRTKSWFVLLSEKAFAKKCWSYVTWVPKRCRWDIDNPPKFSLALNLLFGFVGFPLHSA
jgi:hypothetical protein